MPGDGIVKRPADQGRERVRSGRAVRWEHRAQGANQALEDAWALAAALRNAARAETTTEEALRAFERTRSRKAAVVSRQAGTEDYNKYGVLLSRLAPSSLATRYYTKWLAQVSTYLEAPRAEAW